jgi:hypothetical protein
VNANDKLERWAQRELERHLSKMIIQDAEGRVFAFGRYVIIWENHSARVIKHGDDVAVFSSKATAMTWCVADQHNRINLARHVRDLDLRKRMLQQDIYTRRTSAERSHSVDFRERTMTKISTKQNQLNQVQKQLEELMHQAKYMQLQGLPNETSRTRRA